MDQRTTSVPTPCRSGLDQKMMKDDDELGTPNAEELECERAEGDMERDDCSPTNVVSFCFPETPPEGIANDQCNDDWPFDDVYIPSCSDEYDATMVKPVTLVLPRPRSLDTDSPSIAEASEWRISLFWQDPLRSDREEFVLANAENQVLDLAMFRHLRDQLSAWIDCAGQEDKVLAALRVPAASESVEPGIGAPASQQNAPAIIAFDAEPTRHPGAKPN